MNSTEPTLMCNRFFRRAKMLLTFLLDKEPTLSLNGSEVKFKVMGDIEIKPARHLIQEAKLIFQNTDETTVNRTIQAYALGEDVFKRFTVMERLNEKLQVAVDRANRLPEEQRQIVMATLDKFKVELYVMSQTIRAAADQSAEEEQAFVLKAQQIDVMLQRFIQSPFVFQPTLSPQEMMKAQLETIPGLKVEKVDFVPAGEDTEESKELAPELVSAIGED